MWWIVTDLLRSSPKKARRQFVITDRQHLAVRAASQRRSRDEKACVCVCVCVCV